MKCVKSIVNAIIVTVVLQRNERRIADNVVKITRDRRKYLLFRFFLTTTTTIITKATATRTEEDTINSEKYY